MQKLNCDFIANCKSKSPKQLNNHDEVGRGEIWLVVNPVVYQIEIRNSEVIMKRIIEDFWSKIAYKDNQPGSHQKCHGGSLPPFLNGSDGWDRSGPFYLPRFSRKEGERNHNEQKPKGTHIPQSQSA